MHFHFFNKKGLKKAKASDITMLNMTHNIYKVGINYEAPIMMNNGIGICAKACAACWDTPLPEGEEKQAQYIGRRAKIGHTSVLEHSNLVFIYTINIEKNANDLIEFLSSARYLHTKFKLSEKDSKIGYLIVGGTWRAFADLYMVMTDLSNSILTRVTESLYKYAPSHPFTNLTDKGLLVESRFLNQQIDTSHFNYYHNTTHSIDEDIDIINFDSIDVLRKNLKSACLEDYLFTDYDLLEFCTITVEFKNMSRIITQQLTRHRNGITQESQRYVNYADMKFNSPAKFKDKYDKNHRYEISFGSTTKLKLTLQELGDMMQHVYCQICNKTNPKLGIYGLDKEDARGYLPGNTQCGKIFVTFTWMSFIKFMELRTDPHAQAEIRSYADRLQNWFMDTTKYDNDYIYSALMPASFAANEWNINEVPISEEIMANIEESGIPEILEEHIRNYNKDNEDPEVLDEGHDVEIKHGEE